MSRKNEILKKIIAVVTDTAPDSEIYLYGSRARGDHSKLSDWDLLILLNSDNISFGLETKLMDKLFKVELETGEVISPVIYSKNDWKNKFVVTPLYENIKKEGIKIK